MTNFEMSSFDFAAVLGRDEDVYDGDTLWLHIQTEPIDIGFHLTVTGGGKIKFRLNRIDCPELHAAGGSTARAFTLAWIKDHVENLRVTSLRPDNYGDRWDAEIYDASTHVTLSDALLDSKNAVLYRR